jgi:hypothetical protein
VNLRTLRLATAFVLTACDPPDVAWIDVAPAPKTSAGAGAKSFDSSALIATVGRIASSAGLVPTKELHDPTIAHQWIGTTATRQTPFYLVVRHAEGDTLRLEILHSWQRFPELPTKALCRTLADSLRALVGSQRVALSDKVPSNKRMQLAAPKL